MQENTEKDATILQRQNKTLRSILKESRKLLHVSRKDLSLVINSRSESYLPGGSTGIFMQIKLHREKTFKTKNGLTKPHRQPKWKERRFFE